MTVSTGIDRLCAVRRDHSVVCSRISGPFDTANATFVPLALSTVVGLPPVTGVAVNDQHGCAVTTAAEVWCWELPLSGQPSDDDANPIAVPHRIDGLPPAIAAGVGYTHSCVLGVDHTIACWGDNNFGALGSPGPSAPTPRAATAFTDPIALAVGGHLTCALGRDGKVSCVGLSGFAGVPTSPFTPPQGRATAIDVDGFRVCATLSTAQTYCRGSFGNPGVGVGFSGILFGATSVQATATDIAHVCMLTEDGQVACNKAAFLYYE